MKVIVATEYSEDLRSHYGVLWASAVNTDEEKNTLLWNEILRLLNEMENPDGIRLDFKEDTYGETILRVRYGEGTIIEYKCMDGAHEA